MKRKSVLIISICGLIFIAASSVTIFYAYRMFTTAGADAVAAMNFEEREALELIDSVERDMSSEQVFEILGTPTEDLFFIAKWKGYGGSALSEMRVYFANDKLYKVVWLKLGFFVYEKRL